MTNDQKSFILLLERFLQQTSSPEELEAFCRYLDSSEHAVEEFREEILLDFLLDEKYRNNADETERFSVDTLTRLGQLQGNNHLRIEDTSGVSRFFKYDSSLNTPLHIDDPIDYINSQGEYYHPTKKKGLFRFTLLPTILLIFIPIIGLLVWSFLGNRSQSTSGPMDKYVPIARITDMINADWATESGTLKRGQGVGPDKLCLEKGVARLTFANGAELILEGPTELVIQSPKTTFCHLGRISAMIPPEAVGFEIATSFGKIVDLGTEFYLQAESTKMLTSVVRGKVEYSTPADVPILLHKNEMVQADRQHKKTERNFDLLGFISPSLFDRRANEYSLEQKQKQNELREKQLLEPSLVSLFDFSLTTGRKLYNLCNNSMGENSQIKLVSTAPTEGCLQSRKAVRFFADRAVAQIELPKGLTSATLILDTRIDSMNSGGNTLFASEKIGNARSVLLQIHSLGKLQLQIRDEKNECEYFETESFFNRNLYKTWTRFTVLIDGSEKRVQLAIDGKIVLDQPWKKPVPLNLGKSSLGNVIDSVDSGQSRVLRGAIQEFRFYRSANPAFDETISTASSTEKAQQ